MLVLAVLALGAGWALSGAARVTPYPSLNRRKLTRPGPFGPLLQVFWGSFSGVGERCSVVRYQLLVEFPVELGHSLDVLTSVPVKAVCVQSRGA